MVRKCFYLNIGLKNFRNTFRSSGHVKQPESVRCSFVKRGPTIHQIKSAVRISIVNGIAAHRHAMQPGFETHFESDRLQLNHYQIQSKEFFRKTKMSRGDVAKAIWDSRRT